MPRSRARWRGLDIPHNDKRYAGYDLQDKSLDPDTLERYIKGGVVAEYAEEIPRISRSLFRFCREVPGALSAKYPRRILEPRTSTLEEAMEGVLDAIREDPTHEKKERSKPADAKSWKPREAYLRRAQGEPQGEARGHRR